MKPVMEFRPTRVGRTALVLAPIAVIARGIAFLIPVVIAALFGVTNVTDAFFYALAFPTFVMVIVTNGVGTVTTPLLATIQAEEPERVPHFVGGAMLGTAGLALLVGIVQLVVLWPLLPYITDFDDSTVSRTWMFVLELLPFMALIGFSVILRASNEVRGRFVPVALSPLLRGSVVIAAIFLLREPLGPHVLPTAMLAGQIVEVSWYGISLATTGLIPVPNLRVDARLRKAARDALPLLGGEVLVAMNVVTDKAFAGLLESGSVSLLEYADRTRFIPQTLLESTLLPVAFATWANLIAHEQRDAFSRSVDQSLRWVAAWTAAPLAGLFIGRHALTRLLYERGEFTAEHVAASADAFGVYVPGVWAMMLGTLAMRAHVVEHRLRIVFALGLVSVVLNIGLNSIFVRPLGINGLALASSIVWWVVPTLYLWFLRPTLRGVVRWQQWAPVLGIALGSAAIAATIELLDLTPQSISDPTLWLASIPCFALLGAAFLVTRPPR